MSDSAQTIPPRGDIEKAEKYINQLVELLNQGKIDVTRTDLQKFDPTSLKDHYLVVLKDYQIEISHSQHPNTNKNSYVMIFNNLKNIAEGRGEKVILAYIYLTDSQFSKFKIVADGRIEALRRAEEEKRFNQAIKPIDELLNKVSGEAENPKRDFEQTPKQFSDSPQIHQV